MKLANSLRTLLSCLTIAFVTGQSIAQSTTDLKGHWEGAITLPNLELGIRLDFEHADDSWSGTIDIPVQGLRGYRLGDLVVEESEISFVLPNVPGDPKFVGSLTNAQERLSGNFSQAGQNFPFTVHRTAAASTPGETPSRGIPGEGLLGAWQGSLQQGVFELRIVFKFTQTDDGIEGTMDCLDQSAHDIPFSEISFAERALSAKVARVGGTYAGHLNDDGSELQGHWKQANKTFSLNLKRLREAPKLARPQDPQRPFPYEEEELTFPNHQAKIRLAGTLTMPSSGGPFPAAVLVTGSGPQDRDEAIMGHRPFLVLADHLTRRGIAVLRYDDRGFGKSEGKFSGATVRDFTSDALAAVEFLKSHARINSKQIGIIGHSEGGLVAPRAAVASNDVSFIVLLSGVGVPLEQLLQRQAADIIRVMGLDEETAKEQASYQARAFAVAKQLKKGKEARAQAKQEILSIFNEAIEDYTPKQLEELGFTPSHFESQADMILSPWFLDLLQIDPTPTLEQVTCPVLAINGTKDIQVAFRENLEGIEASIRRGGNQDVMTIAFPDLNHLFQTSDTGAVSEYGLIEETFNEKALRTVSDWILSKTR